VIAHNTQQHCDFVSTLPPEELLVTPSLETTDL